MDTILRCAVWVGGDVLRATGYLCLYTNFPSSLSVVCSSLYWNPGVHITISAFSCVDDASTSCCETHSLNCVHGSRVLSPGLWGGTVEWFVFAVAGTPPLAGWKLFGKGWCHGRLPTLWTWKLLLPQQHSARLLTTMPLCIQ